MLSKTSVLYTAKINSDNNHFFGHVFLDMYSTSFISYKRKNTVSTPLPLLHNITKVLPETYFLFMIDPLQIKKEHSHWKWNNTDE